MSKVEAAIALWTSPGVIVLTLVIVGILVAYGIGKD